jgi:hypothetical protein
MSSSYTVERHKKTVPEGESDQWSEKEVATALQIEFLFNFVGDTL